MGLLRGWDLDLVMIMVRTLLLTLRNFDGTYTSLVNAGSSGLRKLRRRLSRLEGIDAHNVVVLESGRF